MQDKQKVTLYLPPELHRQLKIRSAVELEPMSTIAERAIVFYLTHSDIVDEVDRFKGQTHRIYNCPSCSTPVVLREGEMYSVNEHPAILSEDTLSEDRDSSSSNGNVSEPQVISGQQDEKLVRC